MAEPRADLKPHAPRIEMLTIPKEFIGAVIGGRKNHTGYGEETGASINIEIDGVGRIEVAASNYANIEAALARYCRSSYT